jgi:hypothetical protein
LNENLTEERNRWMAALSAAEQLIASMPAIPYGMSFRDARLDLMVRRGPSDVVAIGAALDLAVTYRERDDHRPLLEATGEVSGVSVRVWSLGNEDDAEAFQDAVPAPALPAAWSAKAVA